MYYPLLLLGLICLIAPGLARFAGYETPRKPFDLVGSGGIFFLLAASFGLGSTVVDSLRNMVGLFQFLTIISLCLGWVSLIVGAVWSTLGVLRESDHTLLHGGAVKA
jgi:hypothetical protein